MMIVYYNIRHYVNKSYCMVIYNKPNEMKTFIMLT